MINDPGVRRDEMENVDVDVRSGGKGESRGRWMQVSFATGED